MMKAVRGRTIRFLPLAVIMALALTLAGCDSSEGTKTAGSLGVVAQPVATDNVAQGVEQLRGKVVVLDLWATWCGPCKMEIPSFVKLQEKYKSQGLEIVGVSIDPYTRGGNAEMVGKFMQDNKINYTIWVINSPNALGMKYPTGQGIPTTYLIDRNGRTVKQYVGVQPEATFENDIKSLL